MEDLQQLHKDIEIVQKRFSSQVEKVLIFWFGKDIEERTPEKNIIIITDLLSHNSSFQTVSKGCIKCLKSEEHDEEYAVRLKGVVASFSSLKKSIVTIVKSSQAVSESYGRNSVELLLGACETSMYCFVDLTRVINEFYELEKGEGDYDKMKQVVKDIVIKAEGIIEELWPSVVVKEIVCHEYGVALEQLMEEVITEFRASAVNENAMMQNPDVVYAVARFLMREFFEGLNFPGLLTVRKNLPEQDFIDSAKNCINNSAKKMKKLFKSEVHMREGAYGQVYFARSTVHKRDVAIKKLTFSRKQENYIYNELSYLLRLDHPNIVQFLEAFDHTNQKEFKREIWIVMEYLEGGTIGEVASKTRLEDTHVAFITREILNGLVYMHSLGIVHRDLKSANVMLSVDGSVKLIDFGFCGTIHEEGEIDTMGSPFWIPPEMICGLPHSLNCDIWSLGVCILELFLLKPPFSGKPAKCMFMAATKGLHSVIPFGITADAKDMLEQMLTQNPDKRPQSSDLIDHPWVQPRSHQKADFENCMRTLFNNPKSKRK